MIKAGQIKIRKGNDTQEPTIVYIARRNKRLDFWVCEVLNTGETVFTTENSDLIDFDYNLFEKMYLDWKIENCDKVKERLIKSREELNNKN